MTDRLCRTCEAPTTKTLPSCPHCGAVRPWKRTDLHPTWGPISVGILLGYVVGWALGWLPGVFW